MKIRNKIYLIRKSICKSKSSNFWKIKNKMSKLKMQPQMIILKQIRSKEIQILQRKRPMQLYRYWNNNCKQKKKIKKIVRIINQKIKKLNAPRILITNPTQKLIQLVIIKINFYHWMRFVPSVTNKIQLINIKIKIISSNNNLLLI